MRGLTVAGLLMVIGLCLPGAALAGEGCPNEQLRAEDNSLGLPDCRAFEMVTPAAKNSAFVVPLSLPMVAADGSSLAGVSNAAFAGVEDNAVHNLNELYRFTRTGSGWVTRPLNVYHGEMASLGVGDSVWYPAEKPSDGRLRLRAADGSVSEIGPAWSPSHGETPLVVGEFAGGLAPVVGGAAEASNGLVFTISRPEFLWPFDSTIGRFREFGREVTRTLYEYTGTGNVAPTLVGVSGGAGSTALVSQCGTLFDAIAETGSTVFFTAVGADSDACAGTEPPVNELFARIDGSRTVAISEPSAADCPSCDTGTPVDAVFQGASADGSRVFFTTTQSLLGHDVSENLYEYDFAPPAGEPRVVRVSGGDGSVSEPVAEVQRVLNVSGDGSRVYFVAGGVLTTAANGLGERAQAGGENVYVFERDAEYPAGRTVFVTGCGDIGGGDQLTPDGRFLLFTSACHLTPGDTATGRQVFRYDAQTGSMVRVSIGREGYGENGNATGGLDASIFVTDSVGRGGAPRSGAVVRSMSDDGSYVFFQSPVGLTPQAPNDAPVGRPIYSGPLYVQNVYEYHEGRVSLIAGAAELLGTSASGGDVFFQTEDQLVAGDTDPLNDFYDARVDGGFPVPVVSAGCQGDACQGLSSALPAFGAPSSVGFAGAGNLAPPVSQPVVGTRVLTRAQKLSRALGVCSRQPRRRRHACEVKAKKRYGHSSRAVKSDRRGK